MSNPTIPAQGLLTRAVRPTPPASGKVTTVAPVHLGTSTNAFTILRPEQNQVAAVDSLDLVAFIHRNDATIYGGSSGQLRYDVSVDGGATFANDIGVMNPLQTGTARYPNVCAFNVGLTTNPLGAKLVYGAPMVSGSGTGFDGHVVGLTDIVLSGQPATTENYVVLGQGNHLPGGLCQSAPGIFWMADVEGNGTVPIGDIYVHRGLYNTLTSDVDWVRYDTIPAPHYTAVTGDAQVVGPNIAFSPDGETGWVAWLGDLVGGADSIFQPVFAKSTDCGLTWGAPFEVDVNGFAWVRDSLQTLWVDSTGAPASDGHASCAFDYDLTVDVDGNPHLAVVICTGRDYSVSSGLAKFLVDVTSPDGGTTWDMHCISPILAFRTPPFGSSTTIVMDNFVQVARDEGGCNIFYSWADSDTSVVTGNGNGIGFGESQNLAPNLRLAGRNVATGAQSYPKLVSDLDLIWDGAVLFPTLAPIVMDNGGNGWRFPIVVEALTGADPLNPASFWYFGNDAVLSNGGWCAPNTLQLSWEVFGMNSFVSPCSLAAIASCNASVPTPCITIGTDGGHPGAMTLAEVAPNPNTGTAQLRFELPAPMPVRLTLHNAFGQLLAVLTEGDYPAGQHSLRLDGGDLASGLYLVRLEAGGEAITKKMVVER